MAVVTEEYLRSLPPIYQAILRAFPRLEPTRRAGYGLMLPTLFEDLRKEFSPGEIVEACRQMERGGAVKIEHGGFVRPTELGEEISAGLTGKCPVAPHVPPFSPPPTPR